MYFYHTNVDNTAFARSRILKEIFLFPITEFRFESMLASLIILKTDKRTLYKMSSCWWVSYFIPRALPPRARRNRVVPSAPYPFSFDPVDALVDWQAPRSRNSAFRRCRGGRDERMIERKPPSSSDQNQVRPSLRLGSIPTRATGQRTRHDARSWQAMEMLVSLGQRTDF